MSSLTQRATQIRSDAWRSVLSVSPGAATAEDESPREAASPTIDRPRSPEPAQVLQAVVVSTHDEAVAPEPTAARQAASPYLAHDADRHEMLMLVQHLFMPVGAHTAGFRTVVFATAVAAGDPECASSSIVELLSAHTSRTVCLVDANLREPFLHRRFWVENTLGFSDLLSGARHPSEVAERVAPNLWLVPAGLADGHTPPGPSAISRAVASLMAEFDFVIFSAGPLGSGSDAAALIDETDGLVLVLDSTAARDNTNPLTLVSRAAAASMRGMVVRNRPAHRFWRLPVRRRPS